MNLYVNTFLLSLMTLVCVNTQGMFLPQPDLQITVRYHQPAGISAHYFSLPAHSTVGDLQQAIARKFNYNVANMKLFASKAHLEHGQLTEVTRVLGPERLLSNDKEFGIPRVRTVTGKNTLVEYIVGYCPPCYDLVCLSDFAHPNRLPEALSVLFRDTVVIKQSRTSQIIHHRLEMSQKTHDSDAGNTFD